MINRPISTCKWMNTRVSCCVQLQLPSGPGCKQHWIIKRYVPLSLLPLQRHSVPYEYKRENFSCFHFPMSLPALWHSNHDRYRAHLFRVLGIPSTDVIDLTDYIDCGRFISAGGSGQIFKGKWKGVSASRIQALPNVAVKVISVPSLKNEYQKTKRYKVSCGP